jgi:hypothetical protein
MNSLLTRKKKWLHCNKHKINYYDKINDIKKNKNMCFDINIFFILINLKENNQEFNNLCCWK